MKRTIFLLLFFFCTLTSSFLQAQEKTFTASAESPYEVYVSGSSTLTDWKATVGKVTDFPASLRINLAEGGAITTFGFKAESKSMDGGRGSAMNDKIYKALRCDEYPHITFEQKQPAVLKALPDGQFKLVSSGVVMIAGVEKEVNVDVLGSLKNGKLTFQGTKALKLSDFSIEPPSAMFGQIETADDITVHFTFNYLEKQ